MNRVLGKTSRNIDTKRIPTASTAPMVSNLDESLPPERQLYETPALNM
jgi:hypothetical protein